MNSSLWLLALVAGFLTLAVALGQYAETEDVDPDTEDALQLLNIIGKSREPKAYHTISEVRRLSCLFQDLSLSLCLSVCRFLCRPRPVCLALFVWPYLSGWLCLSLSLSLALQ